jgi:uncharacterized protein YhhL (DUF1145 family)
MSTSMTRVAFGVVVAVILVNLIETQAGDDAASMFVVLLLSGVAVFHHAELSVFAAQLQQKLEAK